MSRGRRRALLVGAAVLAAIPVVAVAIVFASGDSESSGAAGPDAVVTEPAPQPPPPTAGTTGDAEAGREVFLGQGCGNCHTLGAAGTTGTIGPVLDGRTPSYERFMTQVTNGGGGMPSYEGVLTPGEIEDVAAFLLESTGS